MNPHTWLCGKSKSIEQKTHQGLPSARVMGQSWRQKVQEKVLGDGTVLYFGCAGAYKTIWIYQTQNCTQSHYANYTNKSNKDINKCNVIKWNT